jgi:amino acid transporter
MAVSVATEGRLKRDALSLRHIVASTLANIAPAMSFFFGFAVIVQGAGLASPITIITAMIAILFLCNTLAQFSHYTPSTGSFVTFVGKAFGPAAGAATSVFITFGYIVAASTVVAVSGGWFADTIRHFSGIEVPWQIICLLATLGVGWLVMRGVMLSTVWAAIFFYFEAGLLVIGAVAMLIANRGAISLAPFSSHNLSGGLAGLGAGFPLAIYLFIGWENSAMLAEETQNPRRNVPRALLTGTVAIGVFYVFLAYATAVGFHMDAKVIGKSDIPFLDALKVSAPPLLFLAYLAGLTSIASSLIGLTNSQARILFNSGREGLLPEFFGKIHPRHQTPHVATWAFIVIALGLVFVFGWFRRLSPLDYFGDAGTLGTIPVILVYMATNLALPVYMRRYHPQDFRFFRHGALPVLGTLFMLLPLWGLVQPGQPWPFSIFPYLALAALVLSVIYGALLANRKPDLVHQIGAYVADE